MSTEQKPKNAFRPVDEELFKEVLLRIAEGKPLKALGREMNFSDSSFRYWVARDPKRVEAYGDARLFQAEAYEDVIVDAAFDETEDPQRSRLKVDALKWVMARNHPKRYGDKLDVTGIPAATTNVVLPWRERLARIKKPDEKSDA